MQSWQAFEDSEEEKLSREMQPETLSARERSVMALYLCCIPVVFVQWMYCIWISSLYCIWKKDSLEMQPKTLSAGEMSDIKWYLWFICVVFVQWLYSILCIVSVDHTCIVFEEKKSKGRHQMTYRKPSEGGQKLGVEETEEEKVEAWDAAWMVGKWFKRAPTVFVNILIFSCIFHVFMYLLFCFSISNFNCVWRKKLRHIHVWFVLYFDINFFCIWKDWGVRCSLDGWKVALSGLNERRHPLNLYN